MSNYRRSCFLAGLLFVCILVFAKTAKTEEGENAIEIDGSPSEFNEPDMQNTRPTRQHQGPVLTLAADYARNAFFSAGKDGFLTHHQIDGTGESWQISDLSIKLIAVHPAGKMIAVYETDGFSVHRVSLWDWKDKQRIYAKRFRDSIMSLSWSAKGSYLMIGNTSIEGITILDGTTGKVVEIFKTSPGLVNLSLTGNSESSILTFGPAGRIMYNDIRNGRERANYASETDLEQTVPLSNSVRIAGYKKGQMYVLDATSGKTLATYPASKPVMASRTEDALPVWFEKDSSSKWFFRSGINPPVKINIPDKSDILSAVSLSNTLYVGTTSGKIFTLPKQTGDQETLSAFAINEAPVLKIDDLTSDENRLFFLVDGSVYMSTGPDQPPVFAFDGIKADRMALMEDTLVFWSSDKSDPVLMVSIDGESRSVIYNPKEGIRSLSVNGSRIAMIEGKSNATVLNGLDADKIFTFTGAGLQDGLLIGEDRLLVSKSSTRASPYPLILINTKSGETVPLPVTGELCFGIRRTEVSASNVIGFIIRAREDTTSTDLITLSLDPLSPGSVSVRTAVQYADEDLVASLSSDGSNTYTNLGKGQLVVINPAGQTQKMERGYALPSRMTILQQYMVSLNSDGSISWFNRPSLDYLGTTTIDTSGQWDKR